MAGSASCVDSTSIAFEGWLLLDSRTRMAVIRLSRWCSEKGRSSDTNSATIADRSSEISGNRQLFFSPRLSFTAWRSSIQHSSLTLNASVWKRQPRTLLRRWLSSGYDKKTSCRPSFVQTPSLAQSSTPESKKVISRSQYCGCAGMENRLP